MKSKHIHVVFCGMDGSGKTTLAKFATDWLKSHGRSVVFVHGHGYAVSQTSFGASESFVRRLRWLIGLLVPLAYFDNLLTYLLTYRSILNHRDLVSDRYFYDKVVRLMFYGTVGLKTARIFLRGLPKPDVVFFLDTEPSVVIRRKQEYTQDEMKAFRRLYLFAAKTVNATVLDTGLTIQENQKQIIHVLRELI